MKKPTKQIVLLLILIGAGLLLFFTGAPSFQDLTSSFVESSPDFTSPPGINVVDTKTFSKLANTRVLITGYVEDTESESGFSAKWTNEVETSDTGVLYLEGAADVYKVESANQDTDSLMFYLENQDSIQLNSKALSASSNLNENNADEEIFSKDTYILKDDSNSWNTGNTITKEDSFEGSVSQGIVSKGDPKVDKDPEDVIQCAISNSTNNNDNTCGFSINNDGSCSVNICEGDSTSRKKSVESKSCAEGCKKVSNGCVCPPTSSSSSSISSSSSLSSKSSSLSSSSSKSKSSSSVSSSSNSSNPLRCGSGCTLINGNACACPPPRDPVPPSCPQGCNVVSNNCVCPPNSSSSSVSSSFSSLSSSNSSSLSSNSSNNSLSSSNNNSSNSSLSSNNSSSTNSSSTSSSSTSSCGEGCFSPAPNVCVCPPSSSSSSNSSLSSSSSSSSNNSSDSSNSDSSNSSSNSDSSNSSSNSSNNSDSSSSSSLGDNRLVAGADVCRRTPLGNVGALCVTPLAWANQFSPTPADLTCEESGTCVKHYCCATGTESIFNFDGSAASHYLKYDCIEEHTGKNGDFRISNWENPEKCRPICDKDRLGEICLEEGQERCDEDDLSCTNKYCCVVDTRSSLPQIGSPTVIRPEYGCVPESHGFYEPPHGGPATTRRTSNAFLESVGNPPVCLFACDKNTVGERCNLVPCRPDDEDCSDQYCCITNRTEDILRGEYNYTYGCVDEKSGKNAETPELALEGDEDDLWGNPDVCFQLCDCHYDEDYLETANCSFNEGEAELLGIDVCEKDYDDCPSCQGDFCPAP